MRIFSGIRSSGDKTLGNYSGGFRQYVATQEQGDAFFCVVDLHSITTPFEPEVLHEATLSVADPATTNTGKLVNGTFALPQTLQANGTRPGAAAGAYAPVGGSASPTTLINYNGPVSNDSATIGFKQSIAANDALRTGAYSKTLTFTLSTTTP